MKIKLTPSLSYVIGLWKEVRGREGIGVKGDEELLSCFSKAVLENELTAPNKLLTGEDSVYFYHTAYRRFFQKIIDEQLDRYKYKNEYSANFFAGLFDAVGELEDGKVFLSKFTRKDEMALYRIGFRPLMKGRRLYFTKPLHFLAFIKPFTKKYAKHELMGKIEF